MREDLLRGLTEEQKEMARNCSSAKELLSLAKMEGIELSDEQLSAVTGGCSMDSTPTCPQCGCTNYTEVECNGVGYYECTTCHTKYNGLLQGNL